MSGTIGTLTPVSVHITNRACPERSREGLPAYLVLPSYRSVLNHMVRHSIALAAIPACCVISRLRHFSAGSPLYSAETGSSSLTTTLRAGSTDRQFASGLLPTPPRDDAVTFSYGAVAHSGRDLHPGNSTHSRAYTKPLRGRGAAILSLPVIERV